MAAPRSLEDRVGILEEKVTKLEGLPEAVRSLTSQISQLSVRVEDGFSAMRKEWDAKLDKRFHEQAEMLDERFAQVDQRFAKVDERFAKVDERFAQVHKQMAALRKDVGTVHRGVRTILTMLEERRL
jgi:predicted  nucleic acid-binding Zn-ribbon protein